MRETQFRKCLLILESLPLRYVSSNMNHTRVAAFGNESNSLDFEILTLTCVVMNHADPYDTINLQA